MDDAVSEQRKKFDGVCGIPNMSSSNGGRTLSSGLLPMLKAFSRNTVYQKTITLSFV
ncbi:hypothetical protein OK016_10925 [Vibrio chagasii]|nr:hypothetical protein [Vibrio chagasii]